MKAVILAGGRGERLRPITDTRPKPLVPVLARPVMDYCLSLLSHHGVRTAYVTTCYLADQIRRRYGKSAFGMELFYSKEDSPLGTAGAVKLLQKELSGEEPFIVMSGDALCDFDLARAIAFHKEKKADVTVILSSVKTPLEYGVVLSDALERILAFSEKPDWSETLSDQVNTGVYILSPRVLEKVPEGKSFDFSRDLFPLLMREGYSLFGFKDAGYWCDIGRISALYRCNLDLLEGKAKTYLPREGKRVQLPDGRGAYFISDTARVDADAEVCGGTVLSQGVSLAGGARVSGSLVMENARLERGAVAKGAVLCENATLREGAMALTGSVLGAGSVVLPDAETEGGKKYPPYSVVAPIPAFEEEGLVFTEMGAAVGRTPGLEEKDAVELGRAFANAFSGSIALVWDENSRESATFASLFAGGVASGGQDAILFGEGTVEEASFAAHFYRLPTLFVSGGEKRGFFYAFEKDGFPLVRGDALRLARFHGTVEENAPRGRILSRHGLRENYLDSLCREMGQGIGERIGFGGRDCGLLKTAAIRCGRSAYNGSRQEGLSIEVLDRGLKVFVDGYKVADTEKIRLYVIEKDLEAGKREFCLPDTLPALFSEHIRSRGGKAVEFSISQTCRKEGTIRNAAARDRWLFDKHHLAARAIGLLGAKSTEAIRKELKAIPEIYITQLRYLPEEDCKAGLLGRSPREVRKKETRVRIRPGFYGIRIISEA
ncbi:MAG: NDP-sugar synthase, partial [Clostridia bacterium]|nr:NDP-sugar synthase [Clostridia bacterium]